MTRTHFTVSVHVEVPLFSMIFGGVDPAVLATQMAKDIMAELLASRPATEIKASSNTDIDLPDDEEEEPKAPRKAPADAPAATSDVPGAPPAPETPPPGEEPPTSPD